jgi:hypothetical protein
VITFDRKREKKVALKTSGSYSNNMLPSPYPNYPPRLLPLTLALPPPPSSPVQLLPLAASSSSSTSSACGLPPGRLLLRLVGTQIRGPPPPPPSGPPPPPRPRAAAACLIHGLELPPHMPPRRCLAPHHAPSWSQRAPMRSERRWGPAS